jgi:hypothetical protein
VLQLDRATETDHTEWPLSVQIRGSETTVPDGIRPVLERNQKIRKSLLDVI